MGPTSRRDLCDNASNSSVKSLLSISPLPEPEPYFLGVGLRRLDPIRVKVF